MSVSTADLLQSSFRRNDSDLEKDRTKGTPRSQRVKASLWSGVAGGHVDAEKRVTLSEPARAYFDWSGGFCKAQRAKRRGLADDVEKGPSVGGGVVQIDSSSLRARTIEKGWMSDGGKRRKTMVSDGSTR